MLTRIDRLVTREFHRCLTAVTPLIDLQDHSEAPNDLTRQALEEALNRRNLESFENAEAVFADLGV
jgi:hypothetical protein